MKAGIDRGMGVKSVPAIFCGVLLFSWAFLPVSWAQPVHVNTIDLTTAIADVAQRATDAVVHIEVSQSVQVPSPVFPFEGDPFFRYFFGAPQRPRFDKKELRGIGTGMVMDGEGHILTNNHVVTGASKIMIKFTSGEEFEGKVVGADPKTDLAVVKIKGPKNLPYLKFGDSDRLRVGEWVVAIGNPRGLEQTVTVGIISAKHRTGILDPSSYQDFIQTDAAINPGNSGGPLLNLAGEVVGVNAAIVSESGGFEGIGFAIPSNMAGAITEALIKTGKVIRGWLGLSLQELTPALARNMNVKASKGALVTDLTRGGPAEKGGIRRGDVLVSMDGNTIESANDLRNRIAATRVGKKVEIALLRKGEKLTVQPVVESYKVSSRTSAAEPENKLALEVKEISILEARKRRLNSREGLIVTKVDPLGPAGRSGLEAGDIIHQIDQQVIRGLKEYNRMLEKIQPGQETILLVRDGRTGELGYITMVVP